MQARITLRRLGAAVGALSIATGAALLGAPPASAHATIQMYGGTATTSGYGAMWVRIPHGCEGKATNKVAVFLPKSFQSAKPAMIAGWKAKTVLRDNGSRKIVWKATDRALPDDQFVDFGISVQWPAAEGVVYAPVIQRCGNASVMWNERPTQANPEPAHPAPSIHVMAGSGGNH